MAVYKRGYQRYKGQLTGHWNRLLVVPRFAWRRLFQQRLVVIFMVVSLVWPLACAAFVYISNHSELWSGLGSGFAEIIQVNGKFFLVFMNAQATFAMILAALAGPGLIAPDLANNALPLYLSRPLSRADYVLARLIVLLGLLSLVTWVPGLLLFLMQADMAGWRWFTANWTLALSVFAGFLMWILILSLVALASSAYVKWRVVAGALVLGFFFITAGVAQMVNAVFRVTWGTILNPLNALNRIWRVMLDVEAPEGPGTMACVVALVLLAVVLILVLERKLRPVEVVS